ncbi:MAG: hypothetical protein ACQESH_08475 [Campylobacterota bacterium]
MTKVVHYSIGASLLLLVVVALLLLYRSVADSTVSTDANKIIKNDKTQQEKDYGWIEDLSDFKAKAYTLPVDEINMKISLSQLPQPKEVVQIIADTIDSYQFFCVKLIFDEADLDYTVLKQDDYLIANISGLTQDKIDTVTQQLQYYKVEYSINKYITKDY